MATLLDINLTPDDRTLKQFGFIALAGFGGLSALAWHEALIFSFGLGSARIIVAGILAVLATLATMFSLLWPSGNRPIYVALSVITYPIGFVLSYVMMATLFFGLFMPVALVFRVMGKDPLQRSKLPKETSYWTKTRSQRTKASYFRQF